MSVALSEIRDDAGSQTAELASFAAQLRFEDLPADVIEKAKICFRDALACCLFGVTQPWTRMLIDQAIEEGGNPRAGVIGSTLRTSVGQAVCIGATAGHGFELDDIHGAAHLHAGSLAVPVALALAELTQASSGRNIIEAMIAGYEVGLRVGLAATGALFMRGHHFQATCGVFVAVATAVNMMRLPDHQARHAFGIAGPFACMFVLFKLQPLPYVALVPLVCWARVYLRAHTVAQVVAGVLLAVASTVLFFRLFHII